MAILGTATLTWPPQIMRSLAVTRAPRTCGGAVSATYIGTVAEVTPMASPNVMRPASNTCRCTQPSFLVTGRFMTQPRTHMERTSDAFVTKGGLGGVCRTAPRVVAQAGRTEGSPARMTLTLAYRTPPRATLPYLNHTPCAEELRRLGVAARSS